MFSSYFYGDEKNYTSKQVGHALHTEHPLFKKVTFSDRIKEVCWQLGYRKPVVPQSMYIYKNPGIGGEGIDCCFTCILS